MTNQLTLTRMRVTKKDNAVYYMPQEVREIVTTDVTYMPVTRGIVREVFPEDY